MQQSRGRRRGLNFTVRITPQERAVLDLLRTGNAPAARSTPATAPDQTARHCLSSGTAASNGHCQDLASALPGRRERIILDLCGGSGAWSEPYRDAGYDVRLVTLPDHDVRTFIPPAGVWGILAAPPCTEFSIAKNGHPRDFARWMECVNACVRLVWQCRPRWWALENPGSGHLAKFLGIPTDSFQPYEFGDPWTKRTALWGEFALPVRGPFVKPAGSAMQRRNADAIAVTPPGFSRAFFEANV